MITIRYAPLTDIHEPIDSPISPGFWNRDGWNLTHHRALDGDREDTRLFKLQGVTRGSLLPLTRRENGPLLKEPEYVYQVLILIDFIPTSMSLRSPSRLGVISLLAFVDSL